jgi:dTDP-4-amino-4,6-dideoxygalactose transaminase
MRRLGTDPNLIAAPWIPEPLNPAPSSNTMPASPHVPLLDLRMQYESIRSELDEAVRRVIESQQFIMGPAVKSCETAVARYCGCARAVGVSSGTDALLVALMAEGIGPGDEVITSPYTFFATAGSIARVGARPVFVDIDPVTFNLDPARIEGAITSRTRAIMPVHLFGQMADMDAILQIAARRGLVMIEDAAQAIGAEDRGRRAGSLGHYGCFSFFPSKNLGGFGDGGMVTVRDAARAERLEMLRVHGSRTKYFHETVGGNFRLDALQAAVVEVKLRHLDGWTAGRQANAERYGRLFREHGLLNPDGSANGLGLRAPVVRQGRHIFNQYVIRVPEREAVRRGLEAAGVGVEVYYPVPLHLQECFRYLGYPEGTFPEAERAAQETLALPIYPELSEAQARRVVEVLGGLLRRVDVPGSTRGGRV